MSDQSAPANATADHPAPKRTRNAKRYTISDLAKSRAKVRGIDEATAAKEVRGRLRANFDAVCKLDPTVKKSKERANDGNRWPTLNAKVAQFVLSTKARTTK